MERTRVGKILSTISHGSVSGLVHRDSLLTKEYAGDSVALLFLSFMSVGRL